MLLKRNLSVIVIATLLFTFISTAIATPALGKSSRVAVITELTGSATVKSSGSSREYDAYIDMGLSQGDYITTDANSSMKMKIKDHEDELTIGANSILSLTTLTDKGKGKKSKVKLLAGSVWSNVKTLSGGDDFEIETPTAVMAVRGTKVLTGVNPETGETYVAVAAGTVSANTNTEEESDGDSGEILIASSQQLSLDSRDEVSNLEDKVAIIDPKELVGNSSGGIIEAIVKDKADIDRENAEFIAAQKDKIAKGDPAGISRGDASSSLTTGNQDALDKVASNLDNLIGNIVNQAIEDGSVDKATLDKIIDEINKDITDPTKKLDLNKVVPMDKTAGVDPALQLAKDAELKKLEEAKKAASAAKKAAEEAAKLKLADALKKLEAEKARIAAEKEALGLNKPTPGPVVTAKPTAKPTASPIATPSPSPSSNNNSTPAPTPKSTVATPVFSVAAGSYNSSQIVEITIDTAGTSIYYTENGDVPTSASTRYTGAIPVNASKTLKAIAIKSGWNNSAIASAEYTITFSTVDTPTFSVPGNTYPVAQRVSILNTTTGATIYYTTNGSTPVKGAEGTTKYSTSVDINTTKTLKAIAIKDGMSDSAIATATYTISIATVSTPEFSIAESTTPFPNAQIVSISSPTTDAEIYYTTNGNPPVKGTEGTTRYVSSSPIIINTTTTLKAIAISDGKTDSAIKSATYKIKAYLSAPTAVSSGQGNFILTLNINNLIEADKIAGIEVHVVSDNGTPLTKQNDLFTSDFLDAASVTRFSNPTGINNEVIFAAVKPKSNTYPFLGEKLLLSLPLHLSTESSLNPIRIYLKLVNSDGVIILDTFAVPLNANVTLAGSSGGGSGPLPGGPIIPK